MLTKEMNMSTFNFLMLLVVNILQCASEVISDGTFEINKRMNGHVIHILSNMGAKMCVRHCHRYKDCNAVNYVPQILKCQLLALTAGDENLIADSEYMFGYITNWNMDTDSCWPTNPCQEDTRCLPTHSNGHACFTFVTPCTASPCIHGYCNITNAGYTCTCDARWSGVYCDINPCMPNPCKNGGTCTNVGGNTHRCACISNTGGSNCQYSCGSSWELNGGTCYYFTRGLYTWQAGQSYCNKYGKLAEPDTSGEISFLKSRATVIGKTFCLGGTDSVTEGTFMWASSNKGITTTDWNIGQPDNYQGRQDCLCMESTFNYRWDDADCATQHQYICETPAKTS